jgi:hypothetical protein
MSKPDEVRLNWREQIEPRWLQAQAGQLVDGEEVFRKAAERMRKLNRHVAQTPDERLSELLGSLLDAPWAVALALVGRTLFDPKRNSLGPSAPARRVRRYRRASAVYRRWPEETTGRVAQRPGLSSTKTEQMLDV